MSRRKIVALFSVFLFSVGFGTTSPAQSALFTSLASFDWTKGVYPFAGLIQADDGNFYGTTLFGGWPRGLGAVFKVTPAGTLTMLYSFCSQPNCTDGENPYGVLMQGSDGNFYGTTTGGGEYGNGTVFRLTPGGTLSTLYSFCAQPGCRDGSVPQGGLVQATDRNFYGTTAVGGDYGNGTVFRITSEGTLTTLHSFDSSEGAEPYASLVQANDGNFYGTTAWGGTEGNGTVFKVTPAGVLTTLHRFNRSDGSHSYATLVQATDGNLYGTASQGGAHEAGTIFKVTPWGTLITLYNFCAQAGCTDGLDPIGGLVEANDGNFYGTSGAGGESHECWAGCGTVFKITRAGVLTTLHSFNNSDGAGPEAALVQSTDGSFYGTTVGGGTHNDGTVFRIRVVQNCTRYRP